MTDGLEVLVHDVMPVTTTAPWSRTKSPRSADRTSMGLLGRPVAPVAADVRAEYFRKWIADGMHGDMAWLARNPDRRTDARKVLPEVQVLLVQPVQLDLQEQRVLPEQQLSVTSLLLHPIKRRA